MSVAPSPSSFRSLVSFVGVLATLATAAAFASPAQAADRRAGTADPVGDAARGAGRDFKAFAFDYVAASGKLTFVATMAAPFDPATKTQFVFRIQDPVGTNCVGGQVNGFRVQHTTPEAQVISGSEDAASNQTFFFDNPGSIRIDGANVVYEVTDPRLVGLNLGCAMATVAEPVPGSALPSDEVRVKAPGLSDSPPSVGCPRAGGAFGPPPGGDSAAPVLQASSTGLVRLAFSTGRAVEGTITLRSARRLRLTKGGPLAIAKLGTANFTPSASGAVKTGVRLTKPFRRYLDGESRKVGVKATITGEGADGRRTTSVCSASIERPDA